MPMFISYQVAHLLINLLSLKIQLMHDHLVFQLIYLGLITIYTEMLEMVSQVVSLVHDDE